MEIVPKPPPKVSTSISDRILPLFSLMFFFFVLFSFSFLLFSIGKLNAKKEELQNKMSALETPEIKEIKRELLDLQEKLSRIGNLLNSHYFPSHFFSFLESKTLNTIALTSLDLNLTERKVKISGMGENFSVIAKQFLVLTQSPEIENLTIESVSLTPEGKIKYEASFFLKDEVIK